MSAEPEDIARFVQAGGGAGGVVDLDDPVLKFLREFGASVATVNGIAAIAIVMLPNGALAFGHYTPSGPIQLFGMLEEFKSLLIQQGVHQREARRQSRPDDVT